MKKNILIAGPYLPGKAFGGPVKSLLNITETLSTKYNFFVLTTDRDLNSNTPYEKIRIGEWNKVGKAQVFYVPKSDAIKSISNLLKNNEFDLIYLNSFFSNYSIYIQFMKLFGLIKNPILVAPRGEFSPGALNIKSPKKKAYLFLYKLLKIQKSTVYTSNLEKDKNFIEKVLGNNINLITANNIVVNEVAKEIIKPYKHKGELKIVTVSRVVKIKNLYYSLRILKKIDKNNKDFNAIKFDIYGPIEDPSYWDMCKSLIESMSDRVKINYKGPLEYGEVIEVLSNYHLFLLPTQGENFGHVIQEALLAACPVIISDQTPWSHLKEKNVGYDIPLANQSTFKNAIENFIEMNEEEYMIFSKHAYEYGRYQIDNQKSIKEHEKMFESIIGMRGEK